MRQSLRWGGALSATLAVAGLSLAGGCGQKTGQNGGGQTAATQSAGTQSAATKLAVLNVSGMT